MMIQRCSVKLTTVFKSLKGENFNNREWNSRKKTKTRNSAPRGVEP